MKTTNNINGLRSPKNRFSAEINFVKALKELGSSVSFTGNSVEALLDICKSQARDAKTAATIIIRENKATYPAMDWQELATYKVTAKGAIMEAGTTGKRAYLVRMWCDGDFAYVWNIGDVEDGGWCDAITPEEDALTYQEAANLIDELETYAADKGYVNLTFDMQKL